MNKCPLSTASADQLNVPKASQRDLWTLFLSYSHAPPGVGANTSHS